MNEEELKDQKYIEELKEYVVTAESRIKYSLERFDILIISLSSGGLLLVMNLYTNFPCSNKTPINMSWFFFSIALIINLLSQITGYLANKYDLRFTKNEIKFTENKRNKNKKKHNEENEINQEKTDLIHKRYNKATKWLNILSFISLTIGIIMLIIFVNYLN
jgi:hypothetical protein